MLEAWDFSFQGRSVKGRAFGSPLARGLYPRASTAEVDPRAKPGAPAAVDHRAGDHHQVLEQRLVGLHGRRGALTGALTGLEGKAIVRI
jgi:hypothetical protein